MYEAEKKARRYERVFGERILKPVIPFLLAECPKPQGVSFVCLEVEAGSGLLSKELVGFLPPQATLLLSEQDRGCLRVLHHKNEIEQSSSCFIKQTSPYELGLLSGCVDLLVSHLRWQNLSEPVRFLKEAKRVIKSGGTLVLSYIQPSVQGSLVRELKKIKCHGLLVHMQTAGETNQKLRHVLYDLGIDRIKFKSVQLKVILGTHSHPHVDPLFVDYLLPFWQPKVYQVVEESGVSALFQFDLGASALEWYCDVGIAVVQLP